MTISADIETVTVPVAGAVAPQHAYVDWPAIIAGILLASAVSLVMLGFGSAIGLSFANFHGGTGVSPIWIGIAAASWLLWVEISSMLAGGYLTGRMRRRIERNRAERSRRSRRPGPGLRARHVDGRQALDARPRGQAGLSELLRDVVRTVSG